MKDVRLGSGSMVIGLALFAGCASDPAMAAGDGAVADAPVTADRPAPSDGGMTVAGGARALHAGSFETVAVTADNAFFRWRYSVRAAMGRPIDDQPIAEVAVAELGHAWRTPGGAVRSLWVPGETSQPMVRERIPGGVEQLVAGRNVFCARLASGEVQCWDRSRGSPAPPIAGIANVAWITTDNERTIWMVLRDGSVQRFEWLATAPRPMAVAGLTGVARLAVGMAHVCALTAAGAVRCYGMNSQGQLGDGSTTARAMPADAAEVLTDVVDLGAGAQHTCARLRDRTVRCWGSNGLGQVGIGAGMTSVSTPTAVPGINDATALAVGGAHACVLRANDEVWCWGGGSPLTMPALATPGRVTLTRL